MKKKQKLTGCIAPAVEQLLSNCKAQSSNTSTQGEKKKKISLNHTQKKWPTKRSIRKIREK
jgi:hypothetical protein